MLNQKIVGYVRGGVPKRSTGADCKSAGYAFVGSNPTPSTSRGGVESGEGGCSSRVEPQPSKLMMAVRVRSPAPLGTGGWSEWVGVNCGGMRFHAHIAQW